MVPLPTLRQLQFFTTLARRRSFSKAAEECFVSQSTLSSAIKELEALLGTVLVDRSTRAFALTPVGEETADRAAPLLAMAEDLVRRAASRRPLEGPFHLGVIPTIAPFLLPKAAPLLRKAYPRLELFLREDLTANLVERLSNGLLDAVVVAFPYDIPGTETIDLGEDAFWLASAPGHPLADKKAIRLSDLEDVNLLLLEDGHCLREHAIDACKLRRPEAAAAFGATSLFTLTQMVQSGIGATLLPEMAVKSGLAEHSGLAATPFASPAPSRRIGLAWRKGSGRREEAEAIASVFKQAFGSEKAAGKTASRKESTRRDEDGQKLQSRNQKR